MRNSLENRMLVRIENSVANGCPAAEAVRDASARLLAPDGIPTEVEGLVCDVTAMTAALVDAGNTNPPMLTSAGAGSSPFPMTGAGLANIRNEL